MVLMDRPLSAARGLPSIDHKHRKAAEKHDRTMPPTLCSSIWKQSNNVLIMLNRNKFECTAKKRGGRDRLNQPGILPDSAASITTRSKIFLSQLKQECNTYKLASEYRF